MTILQTHYLALAASVQSADVPSERLSAETVLLSDELPFLHFLSAVQQTAAPVLNNTIFNNNSQT